ncbi:hypothetical protein H238_2997 [Klebsiella pneumoniae UHKPC179]|nr:hypothetical protein CSC13_2664 [Klebsiella pneumoniae]EPA90404.1 hypothetical protein H237_3005 [Klebsiella pneumoniae UHKPC57]EPO90246.1 hypothetical protein H238_2997 [Klebsiella pneumoniae UHKPC179]QBF21393.1 Hypothetical protein KpB31_2865 [Klebsiella pneumoniae]CDL15213.1 hypothetical protein [Klebsiella pneumoniae IS46]
MIAMALHIMLNLLYLLWFTKGFAEIITKRANKICGFI